MNKAFILGLLIGFSLSVEPLREEYSECVQAVPNSPEECFPLKTEYFQQTCCYFYGTYKDLEGKTVTGPACLEAYKKDVSTGARKAETQKKIEDGKYWPDYDPITNIKSFLCYGLTSECEKIQPADNEEDCFNSYPELTSEGCCYLESDWKEGDKYEKMQKNCVDILLKDSKTKKDIEKTKARILNGTYWDGDFGEPKEIKTLKCKNTNSSSLKTNLLALALILFLF